MFVCKIAESKEYGGALDPIIVRLVPAVESELKEWPLPEGLSPIQPESDRHATSRQITLQRCTNSVTNLKIL